MNDYLSRLNVRVEYAHDYEHSLWKSLSAKSLFSLFLNKIIRTISQWVAYGVDTYSSDEINNKKMQSKYSQRSLQIPDFNIGLMEFNISNETNEKMNQHIPVLVDAYFKNHAGEKVVIRYFQLGTNANPAPIDAKLPQPMPKDVQRKLSKVLQNPDIPTRELFNMPGKTLEELELLRQRELTRLEGLSQINEEWDTADIFQQLAATPSTMTPPQTINEEPTLLHDVLQLEDFYKSLEASRPFNLKG